MKLFAKVGGVQRGSNPDILLPASERREISVKSMYVICVMLHPSLLSSLNHCDSAPMHHHAPIPVLLQRVQDTRNC